MSEQWPIGWWVERLDQLQRTVAALEVMSVNLERALEQRGG